MDAAPGHNTVSQRFGLPCVKHALQHCQRVEAPQVVSRQPPQVFQDIANMVKLSSARYYPCSEIEKFHHSILANISSLLLQHGFAKARSHGSAKCNRSRGSNEPWILANGYKHIDTIPGGPIKTFPTLRAHMSVTVVNIAMKL